MIFRLFEKKADPMVAHIKEVADGVLKELQLIRDDMGPKFEAYARQKGLVSRCCEMPVVNDDMRPRCTGCGEVSLGLKKPKLTHHES